MKTPNIFVENKQKLSDSETSFFQNQIADVNNHSPFVFFIESLKNINGSYCPHCGSEKIVKNGKLKNKTPRFYCNSCKKGYSLYTGTLLQYQKLKNKLFDYITIRTSDCGTLRFCSKSIGISLNTSFEWNKKIFGSMEKTSHQEMDGIVELNIFEEKTSRKGEKNESFTGFKFMNLNRIKKNKHSRAPKLNVPIGKTEKVQIATMFARKGKIDMKVIQLGDLSNEDLKKNIYSRIRKTKNILIPNLPVLKIFLQHKKKKHYICSLCKRVKEKDKYFDIETVNQIFKLFKKWMKRFRGVATKYLQNYIKWFLHNINFRNFDLSVSHLILDGLQNKNGKWGFKKSFMFTDVE